MNTFEASYRNLHTTGELAQRVSAAQARQHACDLCGRSCGADRYVEPGSCRMRTRAWVSSYGPHHGEENPLRGSKGSGTIFFSSCNLRCCYCQNADISQKVSGMEVDAQELAAIMLSLQDKGCHNINFVSPSHVTAEILAALLIAAQLGLHLPLVWNTGGYDSMSSLTLLDGIIDIYMPDMKYADADIASRLSGITDYPRINQQAVREMHRQTGDLILDERGLAQRGLLIRHLILPGNLAGTAQIMRFLAEEISVDTYVNLMEQYRPCYQAHTQPPLDRTPTQQEFKRAHRDASAAGITRLDQRTSSLRFF